MKILLPYMYFACRYDRQLLTMFELDRSVINPIALRMAKTLWSFGRSECNRVNSKLHIELPKVEVNVNLFRG